MRVTPAVALFERRIRARFPLEFRTGMFHSLGIYNRRRIAGSGTWSQHAWGNAWDVGVKRAGRGRFGAGSRLAKWLRAERAAGRLPVGLVLWRVPNHFDHLHIEGVPKMTGTPPLLTNGGSNVMEALKKVVTGIQQVLLDAGYDLPVYGADGLWGNETQAALLAMAHDARTGTPGTPQHTHYQPDATGGVIGLP